jgi:hypothetical protein
MARGVEPREVAGSGPSCRNCGARAEGVYCPACGQETKLALPTARQFLKDAAGRYVALDGRLWRTLLPLVTRPGFLTREYFEGRRRRYIRPARLFLVLSLLMFALIRITLEVLPVEVGEAVVVDGPEPPKPPAPAEPAPAPPKQPGPAREPPDLSAMPLPGVVVQFDRKGDLDVTGFSGPFGDALKRRIDRFNRLSRSERVEEVVYGMIRYGPYAMFALLPAFALLLKLVYLGGRARYPARPRTYAAHLVFAAHNHAFFFVLVTFGALVSSGWLRALAALWAVVYGLRSMKVVYGGRWLGVIARAVLLALAYLVLFALATAALILPAVMLR